MDAGRDLRPTPTVEAAPGADRAHDPLPSLALPEAPTFFISIASYRDPELIPTIADCLAKARRPELLRFGICWQHGPEESLPFVGDPRFRVIDVDWRASRGACWARAEIMKRYEGEACFLQLDSHHRFAEGWDEKLLAQLARTGSPKPILTTYPPNYTPGDPSSFGAEPLQTNFHMFAPDGIPELAPGDIPNWQAQERPLRARFLSAGFLCALGAFVTEVPYDPELYFFGEEITLAIRAFTHGWDFFHPTEIIVWHEYDRRYRAHKHWNDHRLDNGVSTEWHERDRVSKERVRRLLAEPWVGPLGCGTARTFADYEAYAGLSFSRQRAQDYTRQRLEPPNPPAPSDWADRLARYEMNIVLERSLLPPDAPEATFWYVGFHDANAQEIFREDASAEEIQALFAAEGSSISLRRTFDSEREPTSWTVWPSSDANGWIERINGPVEIVVPANGR